MKEQDREKNFEDLLRQKAEGFGLKPSDDVWANVKIALTDDKRKRRFLWFWAAAIGLLLGSGVFGWMLLDRNHSSTLNQEIAKSNEAGDNSISKQKPTEPGGGINEKGITAIQSAPGDEPHNQIEQSVAAPKHSNNSYASEKVSTKPSTRGDKATGDSVINSAASLDSTLAVNAVADLHHESEALTDIKTESAVADQQTDSSLVSNQLSNVAKNTIDSTTVEPLTLPSTADAYYQHRFSVGGEVIPFVSYRTLHVKSATSYATTANVSTNNDSLTKLINQYSSPSFGYAAGINFDYWLSRKFALSAGLHFSNAGYKVSISNPADSIIFPAGGATSSDTSSNAGSIPGFGTSYSVAYEPGPGYEAEQRFKWLDFSAGCSWIFWQQGKNELSLDASLGVSAILQYKITGYDGQESLKNYPLFGGNSETFNEFALTSSAGVDYRRILSPHLSISGGLQFHYFLSNALSKDFNNTMHPYWGGVNAGIAYRF